MQLNYCCRLNNFPSFSQFSYVNIADGIDLSELKVSR